MKILFIGNSITLHGKCSYWPGEWGMAASAKEKDYVHLLIKKLRESGRQAEYSVINFFKWEIMDYDRDEALFMLDDLLKDSYDYIVVQLGENISSVATLERDFCSLMTYLQKSCPKENILVCSSFFIRDAADFIKESVCLEMGGQYVSFKDIRGIAPYIAGDNIEVKADDGIYHIRHAGVAVHPGDKAMEIYAERLFVIITKKKIKEHEESGEKTDSNKILFVVHKQNEDHYAACIKSIQELKIPAGKTVEILSWTGNSTAVSCSQLYHAIIRKTNAKYKIYIPDTTSFVYEKALPDMLEIFAADDKIAALGVCGAKSLPNAGLWQQADDKLGAVYALQEDGSVWEQRYNMPADSYEYAQYINEVMLAVQYDVECKEAAGNDSYAMEYSREVIRQGYKIVVPRQIITWCLSTSLEQLKQDFC